MWPNFVYVRSPGSMVVHRYYGKKYVEGEKVQCGMRMRPGWKFSESYSRLSQRRCRRCGEL